MVEEGWPLEAKPCGDELWWHGHVYNDGEAVAVSSGVCKVERVAG